MSIAKKHPFAALVLTTAICAVIGLLGSIIVFNHDEREFYRTYKAEQEGAPPEFRDGALAYYLAGISIGTFAGLLAGSFLYLKAREQSEEVLHVIVRR